MSIKASVPAIEVINRAALTATVTGTAAFEATLLGRPRLLLARLSAWTIGHIAMMANLRTEILDAIMHRLPMILSSGRVAKLMSVRYPFYFGHVRVCRRTDVRLKNMQVFFVRLARSFLNVSAAHNCAASSPVA